MGALRLGILFVVKEPISLEVLHACDEHVPCEVLRNILRTFFGSEKRAAVYRL